MTKKEKIMQEVEKTLQAIDRIPELDTDLFLFTKLKTKIEGDSVSQIKNSWFGFKPAIAAVALILIINIITTFYFFKTTDSTAAVVTEQATLVKSLSKDYQITQTQYENLILR